MPRQLGDIFTFPIVAALPVAGEVGQVVTLVTDGKQYAWDTVSASWKVVGSGAGGGGATEVYIGPNAPAPRTSELIWIDTDEAAPATLNLNMDGWHTIGAAGEPGFQNSWTNSGAAANTVPGFRKFPDGRVRLRGTVKGGLNGTVLFNLPPGYRPPKDMGFPAPVASGASMGLVSVQANGDVWLFSSAITAGSTSWLDSVEFDIETVLQVVSLTAQPLDTVHRVNTAGEPAIQGAWTITDAAARPPRFRKYPDGRVRLAGIIASGAVPSTAFTLPAGYRPPATVYVSHSANNAFALTQINADGTVVPFIGSNVSFVLDGIEFDTETVSTYSSGIIGPPEVTALPANPVHGQECYFVADAANGVKWHLRYNTASASALKWEWVGGTEIFLSESAIVGVTAAINVVQATAMTFPVPLTGDYICEISCLWNGAADARMQAWLLQAGAQIVSARHSEAPSGGQPNDYNSSHIKWVLPNVPVAAAIAVGLVRATAVTSNAYLRSLSIRPRRVG